ncbi:MAG: bifunctional acetate--CoA ligase family protein/GNAT family N-acetyltransferase [Desulfopila sp.]|jgi:acetyltransferase|nr:bifunctional acetate--CoA ligase family protein/GNAT family N-acetyltransferase [Desulfopila sp.]
MGMYNLDKMFQPSSVAVIGASDTPGRIGTALMNNLIKGGFTGKLYPVNPAYEEIMGLKAVQSIASIEEHVDLAVIAVPIVQVPSIITQCGTKGVNSVIVISAGGKESGENGAAIEKEIFAAAAIAGIRVLGPNCLGLMAPHCNLNASFAADMPQRGDLAFVSQSGAICTAILDRSFKEGIGFSYFVSIGSMGDVDFGDLIDYLGRQPTVKSILLYIEHLTNVRKFMSAARAISRVKPVFVLKAGASNAGARAAASHTGSLAGEDDIYDAAFKRAGVIRVHTIAELFDCAELIAKYSRPAGASMAVVTNGGGPGVMAVDAIVEYGLDLAPLSAPTIAELDDFLPPCWSKANPVDILGDASAERYRRVIDILLCEKSINALMVILAPQALTQPLEVAQTLITLVKRRSLPVFAVWMGGRDVEAAIQALNNAGIATYDTPDRAVVAFKYMVQHTRNLEMLREIPPRIQQSMKIDKKVALDIVACSDLRMGGFLPELQAREIVQAYSIPMNTSISAKSADEAVGAAQQLGRPVVLKILSPDISHKTDAKGVHLNLHDENEVRRAFAAIISAAKSYNPEARIEGVSVQPFIENPDFELLLGCKRDETFGPAVLFGMGGIFTEILNDRAIGLPPLNFQLIERLIQETKISRVLNGFRNLVPVDMDVLKRMLLSLSQLVTDIPEVVELDINPVIVKQGKPLALDVRIRLAPTSQTAPMHLVISPYPAHYERYAQSKSGFPFFVRPIKPEDTEAFIDLFNSLSRTSVYFRFFSYITELTPEMLAMLTQVDYDRHMALVALDTSCSPERMLGVARVIADPEISNAEFSIVVGDPWQGQGIGAQLLLQLIDVAGRQGVKRMWGTVLKENHQMLNLARRSGFTLRKNPEEGTYDLTIDLSKSAQMACTATG